MEILYLPKFIKQYKKIPIHIKQIAITKEKVFRNDPFDLSLKTHKLHGDLKTFYSFSLDIKYRIIFDFINRDTIRFYSIGNHDIYEH